MVDLGSTHFLQFCIQWSSIVLLYYDYLLTFPSEVKYIWQQKFKLSSALYFCCRYAMVSNLVYLLGMAKSITKSVPFQSFPLLPLVLIRELPHSCDHAYTVAAVFSVLGRFAVIAVWSARTYAVYSANRFVLLFFGISGLTCVILQIVHVPVTSCKEGSSLPIGDSSFTVQAVIYALVGGLISALMVVIEFTSWALTTFRCVQALRVMGGSWRSQRSGFMYLVLEQGILYFAVVSILAIASLVLNASIPGGFFQRLLNAYNLPVSGMLTARFLLHLRQWEEQQYINGPPASSSSARYEITSELDIRTGTIASMLEDFGEDPVRRSRREMRARESARNRVAFGGSSA